MLASTGHWPTTIWSAGAAVAVEKGLADAKWYASPVPKDKMRELLERRDGPAIRDTLIWFALLLASAGRGCAMGQLVGDYPLRPLRRDVRLHVRFALARVRSTAPRLRPTG